MKLRNRYLVFSSKRYSFLRLLLAIIIASSFYISNLTGYLWLYGVSFILLLIVVATMNFLYSYVVISDIGIKLCYGLWKTYEIRWEDIQYCGVFSLAVLGAWRDEEQEEYIYFSKKPVPYSQLHRSNTIPPQSGDFVYFVKHDSVLLTIKEMWHDKKANKLCTESYSELNSDQTRKHRITFFVVALCLSCAICVIAYMLSLDWRWIAGAFLCILGLFEAINVI